MKHDILLSHGLEALELTTSTFVIESFLVYLKELKKWNSKVCNLTSLKKEKDIVVRHFLDSLLYLKVMPLNVKKIVDIGSGAGFPGIPIKIIKPDFSLTIIESNRKKCHFLKHLLRQLQIKHVDILHSRLENVKMDGDFDAAVTRALYRLKEFVEKASHLIKEGGFLVVSKGQKIGKELHQIKDYDFRQITLSLPLSDIKRHLVVIKKP